jgi:hypothetical protein
MVSYYDITLTSLLINYYVTSDFCLHGMHDTSYDTPIVASLSRLLLSRYKNELVIRPRRNGWLDIRLEFALELREYFASRYSKQRLVWKLYFYPFALELREYFASRYLVQETLRLKIKNWALTVSSRASTPNELVHDQKEQRKAMNREPNGDRYCTSIQLRTSTGSIYKDTHWQSI